MVKQSVWPGKSGSKEDVTGEEKDLEEISPSRRESCDSSQDGHELRAGNKPVPVRRNFLRKGGRRDDEQDDEVSLLNKYFC